MTIRTAALISSIAGVLGLVAPMQGLLTAIPGGRWTLPASAVILLASLTLPVFCFALFREPARLRFSLREGRLALTAAGSLSLITAADIQSWLRASGSVLEPTGMWNAANALVVLGFVSNIAYAGLLIAIWRQLYWLEASPRYTGMLRVTAKLAVVFWGIWVAFSVVRIVATPYVYYSSLEAVRRGGYAVSFFRDVLWEPVHSTVIALSLLVAPFLVRRAMSR